MVTLHRISVAEALRKGPVNLALIKDILFGFRWAQVVGLAAIAIPLGLVAGANGFSASGAVTVATLAMFATSLLLRGFFKSVYFWWCVWGIALIVWLINLSNILLHARNG